jgi:hypothetical protein
LLVIYTLLLLHTDVYKCFFPLSLSMSITMYTSGHGELVKMATEYNENSSIYLVLVIRDLYSLVRVFEAGLNLKFPRIKNGSSILIKYIGFLNLDLFRVPYENAKFC